MSPDASIKPAAVVHQRPLLAIIYKCTLILTFMKSRRIQLELKKEKKENLKLNKT